MERGVGITEYSEICATCQKWSEARFELSTQGPVIVENQYANRKSFSVHYPRSYQIEYPVLIKYHQPTIAVPLISYVLLFKPREDVLVEISLI